MSRSGRRNAGPSEINTIASFRHSIAATAKRDSLTIRQTYQRVLSLMGHTVFKGSARQLADMMENWYTSQACDGLNVLVPVLPRGLTDFVEMVVPELQRYGLFRSEYRGNTLREIMGLPRPKNPISEGEPECFRPDLTWSDPAAMRPAVARVT